MLESDHWIRGWRIGSRNGPWLCFVCHPARRSAHAARARSVAARAGDVRFSAMDAASRAQPRLSDAMGADLAVGRPDPRRLPAAVAPLRRGYRRRQILSVHCVPRIRRRHARRGHARQCPPRHRAGRHHRILDRRTLCGAGLYDCGAAGAAADPVRRTEPASHRGCLHSQQCAVDPGAGKVRLHARGVGAPLSLHQRDLAGPLCCSACCTRIFTARHFLLPDRNAR